MGVWPKLAVCAALCASALSCGGGSGRVAGVSGSTTSAASNVATVIVDAGPVNNSVNTLYTTVTLCVPGSTTNCQTIDHVQVDTGSVGLRILAPVLTLSLPLQTTALGNTLAECAVFADGYSWGPIASADVQVAGETASAVPIQVIGDASFATVPEGCSSAGPTEEDTVETFGANGILGIGVFAQDCGGGCVTEADPEFYYTCSATLCQPTTAALAGQVPNPVTLFTTDSNGSIIELPSVAAEGAATVTGSLIFGVDTESNNVSGTETVLTVDPQFGDFTAVFDGVSLGQSFIDSGSNGVYFDDSGIALCTESGLTDFYCPASTQNLTVTLQGANGVNAAVQFSVGNAETLGSDNPTFAVLPTLAGSTPLAGNFDFGLPFFYGRRVATVLQSKTTTVGTGPYIAF
jgi:hypothetical protein